MHFMCKSHGNLSENTDASLDADNFPGRPAGENHHPQTSEAE